MADDPRDRPQPPGHGSPGGAGRAARAGTNPGDEQPPILDQVFGRDSLYALRAAAAAHAAHAGLQQGRVEDFVAAVHELAANAVRHGGGRGRLRVWKHRQALYCQVTDDGAPPGGDPGTDTASRGGAPWRIEPGHGLWLVRQIADQTSLQAGPHGTTATVSFTLEPPGQLPPFHLAQRSQGGCTVLAITGQLDLHTAGQLTSAISDLIAAGPALWLILDLTGLSFWDSSGLAALITAQQRVSARPGAQLILAGLPGQLMQRLQDTGMAGRFTIAGTTADAIHQLGPPA
jgi:anti-anti-sigma factor